MMQKRQPAKDCVLNDGDVALDSRKTKSSDADVIKQTPEPEFVACSVVGGETREASYTENAPSEESKNELAVHDECPIPVGKVSEPIRYLDKTRQRSNCTELKTEGSIWSPEVAKYGASMFHMRAT